MWIEQVKEDKDKIHKIIRLITMKIKKIKMKMKMKMKIRSHRYYINIHGHK